jgi:hypothetical protein
MKSAPIKQKDGDKHIKNAIQSTEIIFTKLIIRDILLRNAF